MNQKQKRSRSLNWDEEEKLLFRSVLKEYAHVIENKSLDTNTNKKKTEAWDEILKKFNKLNGRHRQLSQLKIQWKSMKVNVRKSYSTFRNKCNKTGGGARPATPSDSILEIKDLLNPAKLLRDHNIYDSDGIESKPIVVLDTCTKDSINHDNQQTAVQDHEDYISTMISHSKILKEEDYRRRMEMVEEEHKIKMAIHEQKLTSAILERKILERKLQMIE